jgi:transglutaminase-like putative cysteine protease
LKYEVSHITTIKYASPVRLARFNIRLKPARWPHQTVTNYALVVDPLPWTRTDETGAFIVNESKLLVRSAIKQLQIESRFSVSVEPSGIDYATVAAPTVAAVRELALTLPGLGPLSPASYLFGSPMAVPEPEIARWAAGIIDDTVSVVEAGYALMHAIYTQFRYDAKATETDTPPIEAFRKKRGVCQDFTHIMIVAARAMGLPAAYVSGYLRTLPPPGKPRLIGVDAMHAWASLWCGEALGWIGFDPTNDAYAETDHIFIAMGRDYSDISPLDGVFVGGGGQHMDYSVDVAPAA